MMELYIKKHPEYKPKVIAIVHNNTHHINERIPTQKKDEKVGLFNIF